MGLSITIENRLKDATITNKDCWELRTKVHPCGYARFKGRYAHVVVYEYYFGIKPDNTDLDHLCRNRACVNPFHLEPVSRRDNLLRGDTIASKNSKKTHCVNGHLLKEDNIYIRSNTKYPWRECKRCRQEAGKKHYIRRKLNEKVINRRISKSYLKKRKGDPEQA